MNLIQLAGHTINESILPEVPRVLDVGSRNFAFTDAMLKLRPQAIIHCYDPSSTAPDPGEREVEFYRCAIAGYGARWQSFVEYSTGEGDYLFDGRSTHIPERSVFRRAECRSLVEATPVGTQWDVVKLDCEGAEFGILAMWPGAHYAKQLTVEFHDYNDPDKYSEGYFRNLFEAPLRGYDVIQHERFKQGEAFGYWDSLFIRRGLVA